MKETLCHVPAASKILNGVAGEEDPKSSRKHYSATASPHCIFNLAMGLSGQAASLRGREDVLCR